MYSTINQQHCHNLVTSCHNLVTMCQIQSVFKLVTTLLQGCHNLVTTTFPQACSQVCNKLVFPYGLSVHSIAKMDYSIENIHVHHSVYNFSHIPLSFIGSSTPQSCKHRRSFCSLPGECFEISTAGNSRVLACS